MKLSIIVPCYNEEESIELFYNEVQKIQQEIPKYNFEYIFVDDGSTDGSLAIMRHLASNNHNVHYLSFARNFGKEAGIYAGLQHANGDLITLMDVDLQDPPELLPDMVRLIEESDIDCVGTRRVDRDGEPPIRSFFAKQFYKLMNKISDTKFVDGARDYRLMTRQMVDAALSMSEYNRFSKGIFSWVGFNTTYLEFENRERVAGTTTWSFWKLLSYSIEAIINFSEMPLNIASLVGAIMFLGSIFSIFVIILKTLVLGDPAQGWPSLVSIILFIGGLQLLCLGILGKYISKIFLETKNRPIYILKETDENVKK